MSGLLLMGVGGPGSSAPELTEHVQNGDMGSADGWAGQVPAGGVLIVGPADVAANELFFALTNGVEYTLRYQATIESGTPSGLIRVRVGAPNQILVNPIVADGAVQELVFVASGNWIVAQLTEGSGAGSYRFTLLSITGP